MMHDGWMSWDSAGGFGRMWFGPIIWIIIGFAIYAGGSSISKRGRKGSEPLDGKSPRDILDERFARGEIDEEEYRRRRNALDS